MFIRRKKTAKLLMADVDDNMPEDSQDIGIVRKAGKASSRDLFSVNGLSGVDESSNGGMYGRSEEGGHDLERMAGTIRIKCRGEHQEYVQENESRAK